MCRGNENDFSPARISRASLLYSSCIVSTGPRVGVQAGAIQYIIFTQVRHTKLWLAGNAANWELAEYEIDELKELLEKASKQVPDYKGFAVGKMIELIMSSPIEDVEKTIKAKDRSRFAVAYDKLTAACNNCHQSTNRLFIVIQRPTGPAFPNSVVPSKAELIFVRVRTPLIHCRVLGPKQNI